VLAGDRPRVSFDWLVFDEGMGRRPVLKFPEPGEPAVRGEVPVSFAVREAEGGPARRADAG